LATSVGQQLIRDVVRFTAELGSARAVAALAELDLALGT
jgi:hypothetical protein